jgi:hypothetical protein
VSKATTYIEILKEVEDKNILTQRKGEKNKKYCTNNILKNEFNANNKQCSFPISDKRTVSTKKRNKLI